MPMALTSLSHSVDWYQFIIVSISNRRTSIEWLSTTVLVKPRQLIQSLSDSLVFLSTTFIGNAASFISTSRNKTNAFAMVLRVNRRSATPENSHSAARHGLFWCLTFIVQGGYFITLFAGAWSTCLNMFYPKLQLAIFTFKSLYLWKLCDNLWYSGIIAFIWMYSIWHSNKTELQFSDNCDILGRWVKIFHERF